MDVGIYVALSRELGIMRDMEVTANDLANMTTTGFSSEDVLFKDYMVSNNSSEGQVAYTNDIATYRNTAQGTLQATGNPLDAAIEGQGYFVVQTPLGARYTRNGDFKINQAGVLVTSEGYPLMDETNQVVTFDEADRVVRFGDDGTVNVDGADRAKLKIAQFDNEQLLQKVGNTLYKSDAQPRPADNYTVVGGMLENSNVNPITTLTHMMYVSRSISETSNYISTIDTLSRKASDTLAKVYS